MSGFAEQVIQSHEKRGSKPAQADAGDQVELAQGADPLVGGPGIDPPEDKTEAEETKPKAVVKIGDKEFSSHEEALSYAQQEIERERLANEAYKQGVEAVRGQADKAEAEVQAPQSSPDEEFEELFFENPKEAIAKLRAQMKQEIFQEMQQTEANKQAEQKAWQDFYEMNPDLNGMDELVKYVLSKKDPEFLNLPASQGYPIVADEVRKMVKQYQQNQTPETELSGQATVTGAESGVTIKQKQDAEPKMLDFSQQLNKIRRRGNA